MSNTLKVTLIVTGIMLASALLLAAGFVVGRMGWWAGGTGPGWMMGGWQPFAQSQAPVTPGLGGNFSGRMGPGMMGGFFQRPVNPGGSLPYFHQGGHMGQGMMGGYWGGGSSLAEPLSIEQAEGALQDFLAQYGVEDLEVKEIMIFDNHAYAEIEEKSTGIGAMEVLVDPVTLQVYPEHGPNMMWNLKYGMMSGSSGYGMMSPGGMGSGMMGPGNMGPGMMGPGGVGSNNWGYPSGSDVSAEMPVTVEQAVQYAQSYLDNQLPGAQVEDHADQFYGYYTLHILRDGQVTGMLSVNGYNGQVFPHTWHGEFVEMSEEH